MPEYSVVVPVYNSVNSVRELAERVTRVFQEELQTTCEIIFVDDGSTNPETWKTLEKLASAYSDITCVQLTKNFGKPGALMCGLSYVQGQYTIIMDDDLEQRPEDIPKLAEHKDHDVVVAQYPRKHSSYLARFGSWFKAEIERIAMGKPVGLRLSAFKLCKSSVIKNMLAIKTPYPFEAALLLIVTKDIIAVPVNVDNSKGQQSRYTFWRRLSQLSRLLVNNSSILLRFIGFLGIGMAIVSFLVLIYIAFKATFFQTASGWASIICTILLTNGVILFAVGVIGEYLVRIVHSIEGRPAYFVRQVCKNKE